MIVGDHPVGYVPLARTPWAARMIVGDHLVGYVPLARMPWGSPNDRGRSSGRLRSIGAHALGQPE
jgi:hypothetical protein